MLLISTFGWGAQNEKLRPYMISISTRNSIFFKVRGHVSNGDWLRLEGTLEHRKGSMWHECQFAFDTQSAQVNERAHVINVSLCRLQIVSKTNCP
jgi:hypothetical protein